MAPWADEEYVAARAQTFVAALELHKALIAAHAEVFESNLAALMELISADLDPDTVSEHADVLLAAWRSFFLLVPVVHVPFEAAGSLFAGLDPGTLGWLLAAAADRLSASDWLRMTRWFDRAVLAGDAVPAENSRYGTWLPPGGLDDQARRWVGMPLRVVHGQDRATVDHRNDLVYDGLLIAGRE
jgi:hypothetical protein